MDEKTAVALYQAGKLPESVQVREVEFVHTAYGDWAVRIDGTASELPLWAVDGEQAPISEHLRGTAVTVKLRQYRGPAGLEFYGYVDGILVKGKPV